MQNFLYLCNANTMGKRICDVEVESVRDAERQMGRRGTEGARMTFAQYMNGGSHVKGEGSHVRTGTMRGKGERVNQTTGND